MRHIRADNRGFTLVEIILTLMIASVVGAMIFQVFGTSFVKSTESVRRVQQAFDLQQAMENITADYESGTALADLKTRIGGAGETKNNDYGQYMVVTNNYGDFISNVWTDDASKTDMLKVTIEMNSGESLTTLFIVK